MVTTELNIEGNPTEEFLALVTDVRPTQVTLVPDDPSQLTSNHGWDTRRHLDFLKGVVNQLHAYRMRVSIFVDPDPVMVEYALRSGADRVELYTEPYASGYAANLVLQDFVPGPDTEIRSLTTFSDASGEVRVVSGGRVIVQDRSPFAIGNPVCIMSEKVDRVVADAKRFCREVGYHGYANFDIKHDVRDKWKELHEQHPDAETEILGWSLGSGLATLCCQDLNYNFGVMDESVDDAGLKAEVAERYRRGIARSPWDYAPDSLAHKAWVRLSWQHQVKKFRQYR